MLTKKTILLLLALIPCTTLAAGKLQNADFATAGQITGAGGTVAQLLNTSKIYDSTNAQLIDTTLAAKLSSALTSGMILVGNGSNLATAVNVSGDATIDNAGALTIANNAVTNAKIANGTIDLTAKVTGVLPLANGGTNKNMTPVNGGLVWTDADSQEVISAGTSGQILQSNGAAAPSWVAAPVNSPLTTKGDLYTYDTANARLPVGTNGYVLTADSAETTGIKWAAVTGTGDVVGPASSVDGEVALFDSTTGKLIKRATGTGFAKLTSGVLSAQSSPIPSADLNGGRTVNAQTGTTYTFALADGSMAGGFPLVTLSNASPITATVPLNSSVAFPIGTQIDLTQLGAGAVTVAAAGGVTINSAAPLTMGQYMGATLVKTGTDAWSYFSGAATAITSLTVASANGLAGSSSGGQTPALTLSTSVTGSVCANGTAFSACTTTGSGSTVLATSPTLVTPILGVAAATTINKVALTAPATGSTLTILDGKTFTSNNTLTLAGTDGSTLDIGTGGTLGSAAYTSSAAYEVPLTFGDGLTRTANDIDVDVSQNITTLSNLTSNGMVTTSGGTGALSVTATTGSGNVVLATSPTITTPTIAKLANLTTNGYVKTSGGDGTLSVQTSPIPSSDVGGARTINAQTGTTYTFVLADGSGAGGYPVVTGANASPLTFTVPPNSSVAYPAGTQIDVCQTGAGKLTLAEGSGVTINSLSGNKAIGGQYVCVSLLRTASDVWLLTGNLIP